MKYVPQIFSFRIQHYWHQGSWMIVTSAIN